MVDGPVDKRLRCFAVLFSSLSCQLRIRIELSKMRESRMSSNPRSRTNRVQAEIDERLTRSRTEHSAQDLAGSEKSVWIRRRAIKTFDVVGEIIAVVLMNPTEPRTFACLLDAGLAGSAPEWHKGYPHQVELHRRDSVGRRLMMAQARTRVGKLGSTSSPTQGRINRRKQQPPSAGW